MHYPQSQYCKCFSFKDRYANSNVCIKHWQLYMVYNGQPLTGYNGFLVLVVKVWVHASKNKLFWKHISNTLHVPLCTWNGKHSLELLYGSHQPLCFQREIFHAKYSSNVSLLVPPCFPRGKVCKRFTIM